MSDYDRLGGAAGLRRVVEAYVARFAGDFIIGFLFEGKPLGRIVEHEVQLAAGHLGGPSAYTGRSLAAAHQPLKINRGHFRRRLAILRTVLAEHGVEPDIIERWIGFESRLEAAVTDGTDCIADPTRTSDVRASKDGVPAED